MQSLKKYCNICVLTIEKYPCGVEVYVCEDCQARVFVTDELILDVICNLQQIGKGLSRGRDF